MALKSRLFRGEPKLEAAAVSHAAHITQGASGEHVLKIQLAVARLDGVPITQDSIYGRETAAAVLAYKQKRNIINRSYQTKADDIVGIMTMAALDQEMSQLEQGQSFVRVIQCDIAQGASGDIAS
jgi:peptidoglycan hydrolase-like protein with peptidoglycan-binding domain